MKNRNKIYAILAVCLLWACSNSDEDIIAIPQISYGKELKATFYTTGKSNLPETNWNGHVGKFGMQQTIQGLSINESTGVLSWNKSLPPGNHTINVIAYNNAGMTMTPVTLENPLIGTFSGELLHNVVLQGSTDFVIEFDFKENGTLNGFTQNKNEEGEIIGPFPFFGSWSLNGKEVRGEFQYEEVADPIPFAGQINQNEQKAVLSGRYHPDNPCDFCTTFELDLIND